LVEAEASQKTKGERPDKEGSGKKSPGGPKKDEK